MSIYTITGTVKVAGQFAERRVMAHNRSTGELLGTTLSNPVTGEYTITIDAVSAETCFVTILENEAEQKYSSVIRDFVTPVLQA